MNPQLYWINGPWAGRLAVSARPRGGDWLEDEIAGWLISGVDTVVSLLTAQENEELQLRAESHAAQAQGLHFVSLPIEDRGVPSSMDGASALVSKLGETLLQGKNVAVHCRQGIGRSGTIVAALLVASGSPSDDALTLVNEARGLPIPETAEQREWLKQFAARGTRIVTPVTRGSLK